MISANWVAGAIALLCVLICTPVVRAICRRWNLYDSNGSLNIHVGQIPRLGGVSIAVGLIAGVLVGGPRSMNLGVAGCLAALALIWLTGLVDDTLGLSPVLRFGAQIGAGVLLSLAGWNLPIAVSRIASAAIICGIVVLFTNALNFLDGSDGLAAGTAAIIASAYICAYGIDARSSGAILGWSLLGASVGFLAYNFPPAKIFMGDSGSTFLGFCIAFLGIDFLSSRPLEPVGTRWIFPILVAAVPIVDGILVVVRRISRGASAFQGDRFHGYDRLLARGWSSRTVAFACYAITLLAAAIALRTVGRSGATVTIFLIAGTMAAALAGIDRSRVASPRAQRSGGDTGSEFFTSK
jgi:UDP-GlcNAc:undecaprenyl-phosphate/decaprenyl-phosphate GlcNAc-1-phosphate transferase